MPSGGEILVILLVVFILFGGKGLREAARTMGKWTRKIQNASREFQRELNLDEIRREIDQETSRLKSSLQALRSEKDDEHIPPVGDPDKSNLQG